MKKNIEKPFTLHACDERGGNLIAECIVHSYELFDDATAEVAGTAKITVGDDAPFEFDIWGSSEEDCPKDDYSSCYVCLPGVLNDDGEKSLESVSIKELLGGDSVFN